MAVLKGGQGASGAQPFSMKDIENHAKAILLRAQQQAESLLAAAQAEAEALKKAAMSSGQAEGKAAGEREGRAAGLVAGKEAALAEHRASFAAALEALKSAAEQIESHRREIEAAALRDVIELAIAIAERVTKRQGRLDPQVVLGNVEAAMRLVMHASDVRIALHPGQKRVVEEVLPKLKMQWPALSHVEVVEDGEILPGGCRVHTAQGLVDADLDEQLRRIAAELLPEGDGA